jgi:creatinine amidohydrolase
MNQSILFHELSRAAVAELVPRAVVVVPFGAVEQHGYHLPVGTDYLIVEHVARAAATRVASEIPVLVTPTLPFGSSHHHLPWPGALSLSTEAFFRSAADIAASLAAGGARRIFLLNGHGGNDELLQLVARDIARERPAHIAAASYWTIARDALVALAGPDPGLVPGHAGAFETAMVLALRPELVGTPPARPEVTEPSAEPDYRLESHDAWLAIDGYTDSPERGTALDGTALIDTITAAVSAALVDFYERTANSREQLVPTDRHAVKGRSNG